MQVSSGRVSFSKQHFASIRWHTTLESNRSMTEEVPEIMCLPLSLPWEKATTTFTTNSLVTTVSLTTNKKVEPISNEFQAMLSSGTNMIPPNG